MRYLKSCLARGTKKNLSNALETSHVLSDERGIVDAPLIESDQAWEIGKGHGLGAQELESAAWKGDQLDRPCLLEFQVVGHQVHKKSIAGIVHKKLHWLIRSLLKI